MDIIYQLLYIIKSDPRHNDEMTSKRKVLVLEFFILEFSLLCALCNLTKQIKMDSTVTYTSQYPVFARDCLFVHLSFKFASLLLSHIV